MSEDYRLSVCIPTFNRQDFLVLCLDRLIEQIGTATNIQIVVVDNCSEDNTQNIVESYQATRPYIKFFKRHETIEGSLQFADTLSTGDGKWLVYLADDDAIDLRVVEGHVKRAENHDDFISAIYCDWYAWNDEDGSEMHRYFNIDGEQVFAPDSGIDLLNFVLGRHVLPEIGIYRGSVAREVLLDGVMHGDFYQNLLGFHRSGTLIFADPPFYKENRVVKKHLIRSSWNNMGNDHGAQQLESLRGQMERFSMALLGPTAASEENVGKVGRMITKFIVRRMLVWRTRMIRSRRWNKALEYDARIRLWQPGAALPIEDSPSSLGLKSLTLFSVIESLGMGAVAADNTCLVISDQVNARLHDTLRSELQKAGLKVEFQNLSSPNTMTNHSARTTYLSVMEEEDLYLRSCNIHPKNIVNIAKLTKNIRVGLAPTAKHKQ